MMQNVLISLVSIIGIVQTAHAQMALDSELITPMLGEYKQYTSIGDGGCAKDLTLTLGETESGEEALAISESGEDCHYIGGCDTVVLLDQVIRTEDDRTWDKKVKISETNEGEIELSEFETMTRVREIQYLFVLTRTETTVCEDELSLTYDPKTEILSYLRSEGGDDSCFSWVNICSYKKVQPEKLEDNKVQPE